MNRLLKIIIIFSAFFICSCLNFNTGSVSFNNEGIDSKYYGTYESSITIKENNNFTSQATANVVVSSGSAISIRITGSNINVYSTAYKENIIKILIMCIKFLLLHQEISMTLLYLSIIIL